MKKVNIQNIFLHLLPIVLVAHSLYASTRITRYTGGTYDVNLKLDANLFNETPLNHSNYDGWYWDETASAQAVWGNSANLVMIEGPSFTIEWAPPIAFSLNSFYDLGESVRNNVNILTDSNGGRPDYLEYPNVNSGMNINGYLTNFSFAMPFYSSVIGLGYKQIYNLELDIFSDGHEASILIEPESGAGPVIFNNFFKLNFNSVFSAQQLKLSYARKFNKKFESGISFNYYFLNALAQGVLDVQGGILYNGKEYFFNDPATPWRTNLNQSLDLDYKGSGLGIKCGFIYKPSESLYLDFDFEYIPVISIQGELEFQQNSLPFLNTSALFEDPELALIRTDKLDYEHLSRTYIFENQLDKTIQIRMPSYLSVGMMSNKAHWKIYSRFRLYFRELSFHYLNTKSGLKPYFGLDFGIKNKWFQMNSGLIFAKEIRIGMDKWINTTRPLMTVPVPNLSFTSGYQFQMQQRVDAELSILPIPGLKLSYKLSL